MFICSALYSIILLIWNFTDENEEKKWNGSFCFVQAADTQLGLIDRYILKKKDEDIT